MKTRGFIYGILLILGLSLIGVVRAESMSRKKEPIYIPPVNGLGGCYSLPLKSAGISTDQL
jgi:hypothetical protein